MQSFTIMMTLAVGLTQAVPYYLSETFSGATFFNNFNFITSDPSGGWVSYVDQGTAQSLGYAAAGASGAYLGVDHSSVISPSGAGRRSVRIESKESYTKGLFVIDASHMPVGCGLWPAFWMYGPNWPSSGEIDIIEGVNNQQYNQVSGHTNPGCTIAGSNSNAQMFQNTCYQADNSGCFFRTTGANRYGQGFNNIGGGVYAMQWTDQWISVWNFPRGQVPADLINNAPNPANWGRPMAMFAGGCNIDQHFNNFKIVVNTDFCGGWAQSQWSGCPGSSCVDYVANNPAAFTNAYWHINYIKVFHTSYSTTKSLFEILNGEPGNSTDSANSTTSTTISYSSATPLASVIPNFSAPADAMGAPETPVVGPAPATTTFLPATAVQPSTAVTVASTALPKRMHRPHKRHSHHQ